MSTHALRGKKVGVLLGGLSAERDVSLKTGTAVHNALVAKGYDAVAIDVDHTVASRLLVEKIDIAFIALHGRYGEDGVIQGMLEMMDIPYTGSGVLASAIAMIKIVAKRMFAAAGLDIAPYKVLRRSDHPSAADLGFDLPVVIKPSQEGSSVGVSIVKESSDIIPAIEEACRYDEEILVEQFIKGREIQIGILDGRALGAIEIVPKKEFYDFEAKYTPGMAEHIYPAPLSEDLYRKALETGLQAHQALGCSGYSRVDLLVNDKGVCYVLEVNTLPGMTATSLLPEIAAGAGIPFGDLVETILKTAENRRDR